MTDHSFAARPHLIGLAVLVARLTQDRVAAALGACGVTYAEAVALVRLWRAGAVVRQADLVASLALSRPSGTLVLNQLADKGLVTRRSDEADARRQVVELTAAGRDLEQEVLAVFDEVEAELTGGIAPRDREVAFTALRAMLAAAREVREGGREPS